MSSRTRSANSNGTNILYHHRDDINSYFAITEPQSVEGTKSESKISISTSSLKEFKIDYEKHLQESNDKKLEDPENLLKDVNALRRDKAELLDFLLRAGFISKVKDKKESGQRAIGNPPDWVTGFTSFSFKHMPHTEQFIFILEDLDEGFFPGKPVSFFKDIPERIFKFSKERDYFALNFRHYISIPYYRRYLRLIFRDLWKLLLDKSISSSIRYEIADCFIYVLDQKENASIKEEFMKEFILIVREYFEIAKKDLRDVEKSEKATRKWFDLLFDLSCHEIDSFCDREEEMKEIIFEKRKDGKGDNLKNFVIQGEGKGKMVSKLKVWFRRLYDIRTFWKIHGIWNRQKKEIEKGGDLNPCDRIALWGKGILDIPFVIFPRIVGTVLFGWLIFLPDHDAIARAFGSFFVRMFILLSKFMGTEVGMRFTLIIIIFLFFIIPCFGCYRFVQWEIECLNPIRGKKGSGKHIPTLAKLKNFFRFLWRRFIELTKKGGGIPKDIPENQHNKDHGKADYILIVTLCSSGVMFIIFAFLTWDGVTGALKMQIFSKALSIGYLTNCVALLFYSCWIILAAFIGLFLQVLWSDKPIVTTVEEG